MHGSSVVQRPALRRGRQIKSVNKGSSYATSHVHLHKLDFSALKIGVLSLTFEWKKYPHARLFAFGIEE